MNKNVVLHQFDPIIYPIKLWVIITNDINEINEKFWSYPDKLRIDIDFKHYDAGAIMAISKETEKIGILLLFENRKALTPKIIAHETAHATKEIWDHIGEKYYGDEANAYLTGWIVDCVWKVKTKQ